MLPRRKRTRRKRFPEKNKMFLLKIIEFSKGEDFKLLLIKSQDSSTKNQYYYNTIANIAKGNGVTLLKL